MSNSTFEERLVNFSVLLIEITNQLVRSNAGKHLAEQLIRSGTSAPLIYSELDKDATGPVFIHRMKAVLKELKETFVCLKIIHKAKLHPTKASIDNAREENKKLISIFTRSIEIARKKTTNQHQEEIF